MQRKYRIPSQYDAEADERTPKYLDDLGIYTWSSDGSELPENYLITATVTQTQHDALVAHDDVEYLVD